MASASGKVDQSPQTLAHLRRARDLMDRDYAEPLDVPTMAAKALMSPAHFSREFKTAYGETPSSYRARPHEAAEAMPLCIAKILTRPTRYA